MAKEQETQDKKKPNKVIPIILGVLLIGGIIFGIKEYIYYGKHIDTDDAQIDGDISPVVTRVGGYVDSIYFEENTHVKAGQALVKIDDRDYKVRLEQAQAAQVGASAGINVNQSEIYANQASSSSARAQVASNAARLDKVKKDYARYADLVKDGSVTQQQFDQAKADLDVAQANLRASQDQYKAAQQQIGTTRSQLRVTNTGVSQKQVDIDFAKLQLSYTTIKAPSAGLASKKSVQLGQLVQAGQTLFSIINDNSLYITANFKETQLDEMKSGQKVDIEVDAYPDLKLEGQVYNFSPVKIKINASKEVIDRLRPGMSVKVSVIKG